MPDLIPGTTTVLSGDELLVKRAAEAIWEHDWRTREPRNGLPATAWGDLPDEVQVAIGKTARAALEGAGVIEPEEEADDGG